MYYEMANTYYPTPAEDSPAPSALLHTFTAPDTGGAQAATSTYATASSS
jgi:hypothetical protein